MAEQLHRGGDQPDPEDQEHERERGQEGGANRDEDRAQHEREDDPDRQCARLIVGRNRERAHDDHEHEQVVDRQASLDHVPGEELRSEVPPGEHAEDQAEHERDGDIDHRPDGR